MDDRLSLEKFDKISRDLGDLILGITSVDQPEYGLLYRLAIWGPNCQRVFNGYYDHIVTLTGGVTDLVRCKPWANSQSPLVTATAHEAAAVLTELYYLVFFPEDLSFGDFEKELHDWVDANVDELVATIKRMEPDCLYEQIQAVAAQMKRERALVLADPPKWAAPPDPDNPALWTRKMAPNLFERAVGISQTTRQNELVKGGTYEPHPGNKTRSIRVLKASLTADELERIEKLLTPK